MPEPGQSVETVARLAPENGSAPRADVEVRVGGTVMARARAFVGPAGAEVRLQWRLPPGTSGPVVTSVAPVP